MAVNVPELLRQTDVFGGLPESELRKIARVLKERHIGQHHLLFRQGDPPDALYVIVSGRVRISATDQVGREKVFAFVGTGEVVGEMGLLSGEPRSATAAATTDTRLLQLRKADFDSLVANSVALMRDFVRVVARRRETTLQRAVDETTTGANGGRVRQGIISVLFSPRGGAGTSTIATNLAIALAHRTPDRVVLLDLDVPFGHVPLLLNLTPRTSLAAISPVSLRQMDRESFEFYLATHAESSLRVLPGVLRPEDAELVTVDHVVATLELLKRYFVHVIVDMSRGFTDVNLTAIERAHNLVVVCTPDRAGIRSVAESQRIFRELLDFPTDPLQYVLNHPSPYASLSPEQLAQELQVRFISSIPFGGDVPSRAALEGRPLVTRAPNSPTSKAIANLAARLEQQVAEARALALVAP